MPALTVSGAVLFACDPRPTTSVIVRFDSDVARERVERVEVTVSWVDNQAEIGRRSATQALDAGAVFPGALVVSPLPFRAGRLVRVDARLWVRSESSPYVISRTQFALPASGTRVHDVFLSNVCGATGASALCTSRETCVVVDDEPRCVPIPTFDELPAFVSDAGRDAMVSSRFDASVDGSDVAAMDAAVDGNVTTPPPTEGPTWFPWHGAKLSAGVVPIRWDRSLAPSGAVIVICAGFSCSGTPERLPTSDGLLRTRRLNAGLYNWYLESTSGARLSPTRVFQVRDLDRPIDLDAVALGTSLWIDGTDGDPDWAVSRPGAAPRGTVTVTSAMRRMTILQPPATAMGARFGSALANAGDFRGRGASSLAVASSSGAAETSFVAVFDSSTNAIASTPGDVWSGAMGDRFGAAMSGGGDIDGDGFADLIVGEPGALGGSGRVRVLFGGAMPGSATREDVSSGSTSLGTAVTAGCDFDGDSYADYAASSGGARPFVLVRYGGPRGATARTLRIDPPAAQSDAEFGAALSCQGDSDGDGRADLAIGAPNALVGAQRTGAVVLYALTHERATVTRTLYGATAGARFGESLVLQRDLSSDNRDDLIVASPGAHTVELVRIGTDTMMRLALTSTVADGARVALSSGGIEPGTPFGVEALAGAGVGAGTLYRLNRPSGFGIATAIDNGAGEDNFGAAVVQ